VLVWTPQLDNWSLKFVNWRPTFLGTAHLAGQRPNVRICQLRHEIRGSTVASAGMWTWMVVTGLFMATDPIRLGLVLLLVTRRRPALNLFAFWAGGMAAAVGVATIVLVLLRDVALVAIQTVVAAINDVRSEIIILAGGRLQITVGVVALMIAANMVARDRARTRVPVSVGDGPGLVELPERSGMIARLGEVSQKILNGDFVGASFVVGLTSSAPPYESVVALTIIMASGAGIGAQFSAFLLFIFLILVVVEIPLVLFLVMPQKTEAAILRLDQWMRGHRRQIALTMLIATGVIFLVQGLARL